MRAASTIIVARWSNNTMEAALLHGRKVDTNLLADDATLRPLWNLYPDYDWTTPEGRQQFLIDHAGTSLDQSETLNRNYLILTLFVLGQLGLLIMVLRRPEGRLHAA